MIKVKFSINFRLYKHYSFVLLFLLSFNVSDTYSQLSVTTTMTPEQLVQDVLVGTGVSVSNVNHYGTLFGDDIGYFSNGNTTNLGLKSGVVMSTGTVFAIPGPAFFLASFPNYTGSDPDLESLIPGYAVEDASILEFDFIPQSDTIKFRYVFGSEEYPEYVCSNFNDVFGFFISGSNPLGGNYSDKNIALIPGTNFPVAINTVNDYLCYDIFRINPNCSWYPSGGCSVVAASTYNSLYTDNTSGTTITYDAFTVALTAWCLVDPCQTYHIKLAIGDAGDSLFDSGVFLEENSFTSNTFNVTTSVVSPNIDSLAIEGCNDGIVSFTLGSPAVSSLTINYSIQGTATNGVDYTQIPDSVVISIGQDSVGILISPLVDGLPEGTESVILVIQTVCGYDTAIIDIRDNSSIQITANDTGICTGSINLCASFSGGIAPYNYTWNTSETTNCINVSPVITSSYVITVSDICSNSDKDTIVVNVNSVVADAGADVTICPSDSAILTASGGNTYEWNTTETNDTIFVSPAVISTYTVTVTDNNGCSDTDEAVVSVNTQPTADAGADQSICNGDTLTLTATGVGTYLWNTNETNASVTVSPGINATYTVTVSSNGCTDSDDVIVTVNILSNADAGSDQTICEGETAAIVATGGTTYQWNTTETNASITVNPNNTCTYTVTAFNGVCQDADEVVIFVNTLPLVDAGADQTICPNTSTTLTASGGVTYSWSTIETTQAIEVSPSVITTYTVSATDNNGCVNSDEIIVSVSVSPVVNFTSDVTEGCKPLTVSFSDISIPLLTTYIWNFDDAASGVNNTSDLSNPSHTFNNEGSYTITLVGTNSDGCPNTLIVLNMITVFGLPVAGFTPQPMQTAITDSEINFLNESANSVAWLWDFGESGSQSNTSTSYSPSHTYLDTGIFNVCLIAYNAESCTDTSCNDVVIETDYTLYIPNAFTPNGDGINDKFVIKWEKLDNTEFEMYIYDRWGQEIFYTTDINQGWDGKYEGNLCPGEVYPWLIYYKSAADSNRKKKYGHVTLIR